MKKTSKAQSMHYTTMCCLWLGCSSFASAQTYGTEATLFYYPSAFRLNLQAVRVSNTYYAVTLTTPMLQVGNQAPLWTLEEARRIPPVSADYLQGNYDGNVVDLPCVAFNGNLYSAQLAATSPDARTFTLQSYQKIDACQKPSDIGPVRGQWVRTAPSPLSPRAWTSLSWTGSEIIVLGGTQTFRGPATDIIDPDESLFADGAAYNPLTDTWRKITNLPSPISGHSTASIGSSVFVYARTSNRGGFENFHLYRYRSPQDTWDEFTLPDNPKLFDIEAFGSQLLLYNREDSLSEPSDWLLDPSTGEWMRLPADPLEPSGFRKYLVHGSDLYLFTRYVIDLSGPYDDYAIVRAARWRNSQWTVLPDPPSQPEVGISIPTLVAGDRLIAPSLNCDTGDFTPHERCIPYGTVFDTRTDTWQDLPNAPGGSLRFFPSGGGLSESDLVIGQLGSPALDAIADAWFLVPRLDAYDELDMKPSMGGVGPYGFAYGGGKAPGQMVGDSWIWKP
jgi:hypothetical protein